jgi:hypothetical protein
MGTADPAAFRLTSARIGPTADGSFHVARVMTKTSTAELMAEAERLGTVIAASLGSLLGIVGELDKREAWRNEGATSPGSWLAQRCGVSEATGRTWAHVAERLDDLPHLSQGLRVGALTFDKVCAVVDLATPETDASVLRQAEECSVRQLKDLVRAGREITDAQDAAEYEGRYVRLNDARCSLSARLPIQMYSVVRAVITDGAKAIPSDGEIPYDQRQCDALFNLCRTAGGRGRTSSGSVPRTPPGRSGGRGGDAVDADSRRDGGDPVGEFTHSTVGGSGTLSPQGFFVVAHTDLSLLRGGTGTAEIEHLGLLSPEAIRRISCDARLSLALDDAFGHTMFEGRARRFPTGAQRREAQRRDRRCRFPGCENSKFTDVHHIVHWADQGSTDLENLATLCSHHHHRVHEKAWQVKGNANGILRFIGPSGRVMTSRPSPLWTRRKE